MPAPTSTPTSREELEEALAARRADFDRAGEALSDARAAYEKASRESRLHSSRLSMPEGPEEARKKAELLQAAAIAAYDRIAPALEAYKAAAARYWVAHDENEGRLFYAAEVSTEPSRAHRLYAFDRKASRDVWIAEQPSQREAASALDPLVRRVLRSLDEGGGGWHIDDAGRRYLPFLGGVHKSGQ